jgi:hypothetical protein
MYRNWGFGFENKPSGLVFKPVVTYDIVSYNRKAVCPNLFAALSNAFIIENSPFFNIV